MGEKSGREKIFDMLKEKGLMLKYKSFEDFDKRNDHKIGEYEEEIKIEKEEITPEQDELL